MVENMEIAAKSVEQAIIKAENRLGVPRDQFDVEVIKEGKTGILGIGDEDAVISVSPLMSGEQDFTQVAVYVLEKLLGLIGIEGRVQVVSEDTSVTLNILGDDLGILIGRRGQTLASLEYVVKIIVSAQLSEWRPLVVDVDGYKRRRGESLERLAARLAEQVISRRCAMTLEPMIPSERRIVHLALANRSDVTTHSVGEGNNRKVVILLKKK